jgi:hypothetical protein
MFSCALMLIFAHLVDLYHLYEMVFIVNDFQYVCWGVGFVSNWDL